MLMDPRESRLDEPHVQPLMALVRGLRSRHPDGVPNVDPTDGGIRARALFLLETPGPCAVGSGFVSRDNSDDSAKNLGRALDGAGLQRSDVIIWNVVPYYVSCVYKNRKVTSAQIIDAIADTQAFIDALGNLRVVVFCGRKAQSALSRLILPDRTKPLLTWRPSARSYSHPKRQRDIHAKFAEARRLIQIRL
jgi:hypothetical protein